MLDIKFHISCEAGTHWDSLTPSDNVKNYDRCLGVEDLHSDAGVEVETLVKQPDIKMLH